MNYRCLMLGQLVYDDTLTWEELRHTEALATPLMEDALTQCGARHINFTPQADSLLVECVFPEADPDARRSLCEEVIRRIGPGMPGRFLFVDRSLDSVAFCFLEHGAWRERTLRVPAPGEALAADGTDGEAWEEKTRTAADTRSPESRAG